MTSRNSGASEAFPSLSSGIGPDELGLRQYDISLDRVVSGSRSQDRAESDTHTVAYNSRFQFFHTKRTSIINESPLNDLASREDSLVKAWRTVSEIDALLGSDFRPTMPTCEEERHSAVDEAYVKRLNTELEAAMNVSLTFKERYRAGRAGSRNGGGGGWSGFAGGLGASAAPQNGHGPPAATASMTAADSGAAARETQAGALGGGGGGGGGTSRHDFGHSTHSGIRAAAPGASYPSPSPRQRHSEASGVISSPSSLHHQQAYYHQHQHQHHFHQHQHQLYNLAPNSPRISPRMATSSGAGAAAAAAAAAARTTPSDGENVMSASGLTSGGGGCGGPSLATATLAGTGVSVRPGGSGGGSKVLSPFPSVHIPVPPTSPGPPASPRSLQICASLASGGSTATAPAPPLLPPAPPQPLMQAPAASPPVSRRLHAGGIRVAVGSALDHGVWDSDGVWRPADPVHEVYIPQNLQRINPDDLVKLRELGRGCFGSVWLVKWRGVEVALKEVLNQSALDGPPNEVFYEAERLASLRHPCVIAFYGIVTAPACYATVVEYMRMGSLKSGLTRLRKQGADITRRLRAAIALQAARGMEYLHGQFLVHFDLKCDNLLCDLRDPARPVVKIGDLGLSKKKKDSFVSGNMRGTLPWMAPELFPGAREKRQEATVAGDGGAAAAATASTANGGVGGVGGASAGSSNGTTTTATGAARTTPSTPNNNGNNNNTTTSNSDCLDDRVNEKVDVFSFGIVLWEIWQLGEQPYSSYSLADIFAGVMTGSLRPAVPPDCDADWAALMQTCWHGSPRARPSFSEIAERLEAILERLTKQEAAVGQGTAPVLSNRRL